MVVRVLDDVDHFAAAAGDFLRRERFSANVIATNVDAIQGGVRSQPTGSAWIVVEDGGEVHGVAMHTPPFPLFLPRLDAAVVDSLAHALAVADRSFPGVNGEQASVARFADVWLERTGQRSELRRAMRMYVLGELRPPEGVHGEASRASEPDTDVVARWVAAFQREAMPLSPSDDWSVWASRRVAAGDLWLWHDAGAPVAMAGAGAPAVGVSRVGPVYTPPDRRRCGYGAAVTATASRAAIRSGAEHVVLYTDVANLVSNSIYRAIGYVPDHDAEERAFVG